jgi:hypothetical protein
MLIGHGEVAQVCHTSGGLPHAVALAAAVTQDVPREGVLDADSDPHVHGC